jgi:hypothetical protein
LNEIVGKTIVIIENQYFHNFSAFLTAIFKAFSLLFTSCNSFSAEDLATIPAPA